ncbi:MAG TPA: 30S ribosomal protein S4e [Candidatus Dormibacteraeota bacterium]|nr:30S ribosomal protein S4e [Candidatus Dormibacteraeota bacterium]
MARKGGLGHLKRLASPPYWPIHRKEHPWAPKPSAGPHAASQSVPLDILVRDELGLAKTRREFSKIAAGGRVKIDGRARRKNHAAGLMDVLEFAEANLAYRMLPIKGKGLGLVKIPKEEAKFKLCKILGKSTAPKGMIQYGTHDGRSLTFPSTDTQSAAFSTNDTLRISIPTQKVLNHIKFEKGNYALVTAGRNIGKSGKILELQQGTATRPAMVRIEDDAGTKFDTMVDYTFVIGTDKPSIKLEAS